MASPASTLLDTIETTWEALSPPDRTAISYRHVDGQDTHKGSSGDRNFWWDDPERAEPTHENGAFSTEYAHRLVARVRLVMDGYTRRDQTKRILNEGILLTRAIDKAAETSLGTGINNAITRGYFPERTNNVVILRIPIDVFTEETD